MISCALPDVNATSNADDPVTARVLHPPVEHDQDGEQAEHHDSEDPQRAATGHARELLMAASPRTPVQQPPRALNSSR